MFYVLNALIQKQRVIDVSEFNLNALIKKQRVIDVPEFKQIDKIRPIRKIHMLILKFFNIRTWQRKADL